MIICKCVDELHRVNKERENDEEREAAKHIVEKLVRNDSYLFLALLAVVSSVPKLPNCCRFDAFSLFFILNPVPVTTSLRAFNEQAAD